MTVTEFWEQYAGQAYELIRGEVVDTSPVGFLNGMVASQLAWKLGSFAESNRLGSVAAGKVGIELSSHTLCAVDIAFISIDKLSLITQPQKYLPFPPDLAVEIVSPGDTPGEVQDKLDLYLEAGTRMVWIVYPDLKKVVAHQADGRMQSVGVGGRLDGGEVLPGLSLAVGKIFPEGE
jgi:Uma2 family endonuclease